MGTLAAHEQVLYGYFRGRLADLDPAFARVAIRNLTWRVYEFAVQLYAIQFWDRFDGRWLRGEEFIYPDRPKGLPTLREPPDMFRFGRRPADR